MNKLAILQALLLAVESHKRVIFIRDDDFPVADKPCQSLNGDYNVVGAAELDSTNTNIGSKQATFYVDYDSNAEFKYYGEIYLSNAVPNNACGMFHAHGFKF